MELAAMTWEEVDRYLESDDRIMIVMGSCEQHGPHLPLGTDSLIPQAIALEVGSRLEVPVAPVVGYGFSVHHMGFSGTVTMQARALEAVIKDVITSLRHHGFSRFIVVNGHGGNLPVLQTALLELSAADPQFLSAVYSWWKDPECIRIAQEMLPGLIESHAGPSELAMVSCISPRLAHPERYRTTDCSFQFCGPQEYRQRFPHGTVADKLEVLPEALGPELFARAVHSLEEIVVNIRQ